MRHRRHRLSGSSVFLRCGSGATPSLGLLRGHLTVTETGEMQRHRNPGDDHGGLRRRAGSSRCALLSAPGLGHVETAFPTRTVKTDRALPARRRHRSVGARPGAPARRQVEAVGDRRECRRRRRQCRCRARSIARRRTATRCCLPRPARSPPMSLCIRPCPTTGEMDADRRGGDLALRAGGEPAFRGVGRRAGDRRRQGQARPRSPRRRPASARSASSPPSSSKCSPR